MKIRCYRAGFWAVMFGTFLFQATALADVDKLNISQIIQNGNDVYLYVNTLDETGKPAVETFAAEEFSVTINKGQALPVLDTTVFQSLDQGISYVFCIDISKSVTDQEMEEIRSSISDFVNGMSPHDYAKVITIGTEITSVCEATQDKNALLEAVKEIERTADYTYLYKGISFALDGQRKSISTMPKRAAIVLFTDGMDDSDGAASEEQVLVDIAETRIPIYAVGLKGKDPTASLNSVGQIARQSGGSVISYNDMSITAAVQTIGSLMKNTNQLRVQPETEDFGLANLVWNVTYNANGYSVSSSNYVYSLDLNGVLLSDVTEEITETEKITETAAIESEAKTEREFLTEVRTETEAVSEAVLREESKKLSVDNIVDFVKENLIICIASGFILIAFLIILIIVLQRRKTNRNEFETETLSSGKGSDSTGGEFDETLPYDDEKTIDELDAFDDEATVDGSGSTGLRLAFEITFEGETEIIERVLREQLVLGRGNECDVDVVLGSSSAERKQTSRNHAVIWERPDGLYIEDRSRNKTYLNGTEVQGEMVLRDEDVLQMGKATVRVRILGY